MNATANLNLNATCFNCRKATGSVPLIDDRYGMANKCLCSGCDARMIAAGTIRATGTDNRHRIRNR